MTLHFLNDIANDAESSQKIEKYIIIASLNSKRMGKLTEFASFYIKFTKLGFENAA